MECGGDQHEIAGILHYFFIDDLACHSDPQTFRTLYCSDHPSLMLKGDWLKDAGFDTGTGVTVKISDGVLALKVELCQFKEAAMGMKALVA